MKPSILGLSALVAILLPAASGSAQILSTFNSNFSSASNSWTLSANWTRVGGSGSAPLTPSDKAVISNSVARNLLVDADGIHVGELEYASTGAGTQQLLGSASATRSVTIDTLNKNGSYNFSIANGGTGAAEGRLLSVQIGNLNLNGSGVVELGYSALGGLNGFTVTGTTTLASGLTFDGVKDRAAGINRIELGNLVFSGGGVLTLGGRRNSNGTVKVSSLSGNGTVQVSKNAADDGTAGTLLIDSANATPSTFSGLLRNQALTQTAVLTVVKSGSGVQILSQSAGNTYSGTTTIEKGVLAVTNSSGSGLGTGAVNILNGGVLAGSGIVTSGSGNSITAQAGGSIAPAAHLETGFAILQLNGTNNGSSAILNMEEGSLFAFRFGAENDGDRITFTNYHAGGLELFDGGISLNGTGVQEGTFTLFTFSAISGVELETLSGRLNAGGGFSGYETHFSWNENSILLGVTAIPEPGLTSLIAAAALLAGLHRAGKSLANKGNR